MQGRFEDLEIWQNARQLCKDVSIVIRSSPIQKDFSLASQLKRSSGSVMDNIAEGFERNGTREFIHFLSIAKGSCGETRSQLYRAFDENYINQQTFDKLLDLTSKISAQIQRLIVYLKSSGNKGYKFGT